MQLYSSSEEELEPEARDFYRSSLVTLRAASIPFLVGGAYALARYTGIVRHTKDFDIFVRPQDAQRSLEALSAAGYQTDMTYPHWLGKAFKGQFFIDLIFSAGNGVAEVDDVWLARSIDDTILGTPVKLIPVEEMIWSKAFIMERERFDGADVAHLLQARADTLDWPRLLDRFDGNWRVLFSHLVLFGFIYPGERGRIPGWVMEDLTGRLEKEINAPAPNVRLCQGTLLSRAQYLIDLEQWGYQDARLLPRGNMTEEDVAHWTAAIEQED